MDVVINANQTSAGRANLATGGFTSDGTATRVTLGFRPRMIRLINATTATVYEKFASMPAANVVRTVTAGTTTITTTSDIVIHEDGFSVSAGVSGTAQAYHFVAVD